HRRKFIADPKLELRVITPRKAVMAPMRAAAVGIQRPAERHALHRVQRRAARHFLIGRAVGQMGGVGQRLLRADFSDTISNIPCRGFLWGEIKEEGIDFHGRLSLFLLFYLFSPVLKQIRERFIEGYRRFPAYISLYQAR